MTQFMNDCTFKVEKSSIDGQIYTECLGEKKETIFYVRGELSDQQRLAIFSAILNGYRKGCKDGYKTAQGNIRNALGIK